MKRRRAKKIVAQNIIRCDRIFGGGEMIVTGGTIECPEHTYQRALRIILRHEKKQDGAT